MRGLRRRSVHDAADFHSKASGTTTADASLDPQKANFCQRPFLTVDEVVTLQKGNCTIFARYVEPAFATQVILTARLTRLYEREDWQVRFAALKNEEPLLLERGESVNVQPSFAQPEPPMPSKKNNPDPFAEAAKQRMAEAKPRLAERIVKWMRLISLVDYSLDNPSFCVIIQLNN